MNLSDKIFGSNVDSDIQDIFKELQEGRFEVNPNEGIKPSPHTHYLGDRAPFARMWTAVNVKDAQDKDDKGKNTVYIINDNRENSYDETTIHSSVLKHELTNNQYLKPTAGITGINSKSEGAVGALRRTTVDFVVHNKVDFDNIFLPFFLRPGTMVFVDFGWSDDALSLYNPVDKINNNDLKLSNLYSNLYDSKDGILAKQKGLMSTLCGAVTKYDVTVDELGSFKCNLEFVSQNYILLDKEINEDNDLKFLFTNVMDELLVNYVTGTLDDQIDIDVLRKINPSESDEFVKTFFDTPLKNSPGLIDTVSLKTGVFYQNLSNPNHPDDYLDTKERLYISFGLFEDLFLNNFVSYWTETTKERKTKKSKPKPDDIYGLKFTSQDSWVRYDEDLFLLQEQRVRDIDELTSYLYPNTWNDEETSNKKKPKLWKDTEDDIEKHRIPLRELFISVPVIQEAFNDAKNINDALEFIFNKIYEDSTNIINIKMISHNDSQVALTFQDVNLTGHIIPKEPLLTFDVTSGNSVVLNSDLKFETPKAGLSSMIAIKSMNEVNVFDNLDDIKLSFLNVVESEANTGERKMIIKSLPDIGFVSQKKKVMDLNMDKLFSSAESIITFQDSIAKDTKDRYHAYKSSQYKKLKHIEDAAAAAVKAGEDKKLTFSDYKDLPTNTRKDGTGKPIKYAKSERHKKLLQARVKNFINSDANSIAPILPVTLSLTIYGNNFLTIGDYINVNFLPKNYTSRVFFQIIGVDHTIDTSIWKTTYSTVMRIIPQEKVFQTGNKKNNINNDVIIEVHPFFMAQIVDEIDKKTNYSNDTSKDTFVKTITDGVSYRPNHQDLDKKYIKYFLENEHIEFIAHQHLYDFFRGDPDKPEDRVKHPIVGGSTSVQSIGQLAWLLAVSDFLLSDKYLDYSKYSDKAWLGSHDDLTMDNDIKHGSAKKRWVSIGDIPKDMMIIDPVTRVDQYQRTATIGGLPTEFIRNDVLGAFDDYVQDLSDIGGTWLDTLQEAIWKYIATRPGFELSTYLKTQYSKGSGSSLGDAHPVFNFVIWGMANYNLAETDIRGEIFINIAPTNTTISDFHIVPNLAFPKRIKKDISEEQMMMDLYANYVKHKIKLKQLIEPYEGSAAERESQLDADMRIAP